MGCRADEPSLITAKKTLGIILDHCDVVFLGDLHDGVDVCRQPVKRYRDDRFGSRRDFTLDVLH